MKAALGRDTCTNCRMFFLTANGDALCERESDVSCPRMVRSGVRTDDEGLHHGLLCRLFDYSGLQRNADLTVGEFERVLRVLSGRPVGGTLVPGIFVLERFACFRVREEGNNLYVDGIFDGAVERFIFIDNVSPEAKRAIRGFIAYLHFVMGVSRKNLGGEIRGESRVEYLEL